MNSRCFTKKPGLVLEMRARLWSRVRVDVTPAPYIVNLRGQPFVPPTSLLARSRELIVLSKSARPLGSATNNNSHNHIPNPIHNFQCSTKIVALYQRRKDLIVLISSRLKCHCARADYLSKIRHQTERESDGDSQERMIPCKIRKTQRSFLLPR